MADAKKPVKYVWQVMYEHKNGTTPDTPLAIVAATFEDAFAKAKENARLAQAGEQDTVEVIEIERGEFIDVE